MAQKPQTANILSVADIYEDFHPVTESKEEPENNILLVHLPDFTKEQVNIACVLSSRIVRVVGKRKLAGNKWSRCNQAYPIPKNCEVAKIHAKWHNGILTITMPKETISQPQPRPSSKEEAQKTTQLEAPKSAANEPKKSSHDHQQAAEYQPKQPKDQQASSKFPGDDKKAELEKETLPQKGDRLREEITSTKADVSIEANAAKQANENREVLPKAEKIDKMGKKEIKMFENVEERKEKAAGDEKKEAIATKRKEEKKNKTAAAMKALREIVIEQNHDKQLLINMGVAVLVIVALGAYVSYRIRSKSNE